MPTPPRPRPRPANAVQFEPEAVLPVYILHHPVLLCVGYLVVQWAVPAAAKFLVIDAISFAIIMALYEIKINMEDGCETL